jgi:glyoxylate reductase
MNVLITRKLPDIAAELLAKNGIDIIVNSSDKPFTNRQLIKYGKYADGIIATLADKFDEKTISQLINCRIIANYAVGFNNIDLNAAKKRNIIITNTPDILTNATADLAMALVLSCTRNIIKGHTIVVSNKFKGWSPELLLGIEIKGKTFGIIGAGRIGSAVAVRAKSFGTSIKYFSRSRNATLEKSINAEKVTLNNLLKTSDIISIHLPLDENTYHLLNKEKLSLMKEGAILVNTARGEIVDETELINLLRNKKLFSAGFDVYENEPKIRKELLTLDNVVLMPHIGSATFDARIGMAELAAKNIINVLLNKKPITPVI